MLVRWRQKQAQDQGPVRRHEMLQQEAQEALQHLSLRALLACRLWWRWLQQQQRGQ